MEYFFYVCGQVGIDGALVGEYGDYGEFGEHVEYGEYGDERLVTFKTVSLRFLPLNAPITLCSISC